MKAMQLILDALMYDLGQLFLLPVLAVITLLFIYAFAALGAFLRQAWRRRRGEAAGYELLALRGQQPHLHLNALEAEAMKRLDFIRIATRTMPMLGLVATMIPLGPALRALGRGELQAVASNLTLAFSAVILALLAAAITHAIAHVRRRWYADELLRIATMEQSA